MPITKPEVPATNPAAVTPAAEVAKPRVTPGVKPTATSTAKQPTSKSTNVPSSKNTTTSQVAKPTVAKPASTTKAVEKPKLVDKTVSKTTAKSTTTKPTVSKVVPKKVGEASPTMLSGPTITGKRVVKPSGSQNKMSLSNAEVIKMANSELSYNDMRNLSPTDVKRIINVRNGASKSRKAAIAHYERMKKDLGR